jgi:AraC-like DNA-binding protein
MEQGGFSSLWFVILTCLALLSFILFILHHPKILYGYLLVAVNWKKNLLESNVPFFNMPLSKSNILPDELEVYKEVIIKFMINEKPFLLHGFQIIHLVQKLDIPVHQCSFIINNKMDKNFRDWINMYRILHFISQYPIKSNKMAIESIANESGFKNTITFYNAFKKETGLMPTAYFLNN